MFVLFLSPKATSITKTYSLQLFKNVAERGRWAEMLAKAHGMYKEGNVDGALLKYMLLAELGYEVAQSNVAYVFDQGTHPLLLL